MPEQDLRRTFVFVPVEGDIEEFVVEDATRYEPIKDRIGGWIESVRVPGDDIYIMCVEEPTDKHLPNHRASGLALRVIVGDVVIVGGGDGENPDSFTKADWDRLAASRAIS